MHAAVQEWIYCYEAAGFAAAESWKPHPAAAACETDPAPIFSRLLFIARGQNVFILQESGGELFAN